MKKTRKLLWAAVATCMLTMLWGMMALAAPSVTPTILRTEFRQNAAVPTQTLTLTGTQKEIIVPLVVAEDGYVNVKVSAGKDEISSMRLYGDAACAGDYRMFFSVYNGEGEDDEWLEKGTYYFKIIKETKDKYDDALGEWVDIPFNANVQIQAWQYSAKDTELKNGKWLVTASTWKSDIDDYKGAYLKVKVPKKGYLKVEAVNENPESRYYLSLGLYNAQKKRYERANVLIDNDPADNTIYYHDRSYVAVQKGTYYLKMSETGNWKLRYTFKADPSKKNYTKKKAISLKKKKLAENVFYTKDKKSTFERWYKIKVTKSQRLIWEGDASLYDAKGNSVWNIYDKGKHYTEKKVKKGTYYFKVYGGGWNFKDKKRTLGEYASFRWLK